MLNDNFTLYCPTCNLPAEVVCIRSEDATGFITESMTFFCPVCDDQDVPAAR